MLTAVFMSTIFKKMDLDEDDVEDDELDPVLDEHQEWIYEGAGKLTNLHYIIK